MSNPMQKYRSDGRKKNTDPLRKVVEIVFEPITDVHGQPLIVYGDTVQIRKELLECGHRIQIKQDIYGETNAYRRRCRFCRKEMEAK